MKTVPTKRIKFATILYMMACIYLYPSTIVAKELADSTAKDLQEVVVEGAMQHASVEKVVYNPSANAKNASQDAIDLLQRMAIPQLYINPVDKAVSTSSRQEVSIFINYMPASKEDITGMRTTDVRRVEYLDYPTDPRFRGAAHVVNFIMQAYEYGGYTKISDRQFFLCDFSNFAEVFSKFSYKKMVYDLYLATDNVSSTKIGDSEVSRFNLPTGNVIRNKDFVSSDFKYTTIPVTFRANYTGKNIQLMNTIGFKFHDVYRNLRNGKLYFEPSSGEGYDYSNDAPRVNRTIAWNGDYYFSLPHQ